MTNVEIYDFIGELAIALYSKKIQISLGSLRAIMLDKGKDYVNNRGMASAVSAAYRRCKEKDPIIYYAIAYTYTDKEGNLAWDDPRKTVDSKKTEEPEEEDALAEAETGEAQDQNGLFTDAAVTEAVAEKATEGTAAPEKSAAKKKKKTSSSGGKKKATTEK